MQDQQPNFIQKKYCSGFLDFGFEWLIFLDYLILIQLQSFPKTSTFKRKLPNLCTKPILSSFVKARNLSFVKLSITMLVLVENSALRSLSSNSAIILYNRFENFGIPYHSRKSGLLHFDKSRLPSMWKTGHL